MIYFIVNKKNKVGFRLVSQDDVEKISSYINNFSKDFETHTISLSISNRGDITLSETTSSGDSANYVIGKSLAYMTEKNRTEEINKIKERLIIEPLERNYRFSISST